MSSLYLVLLTKPNLAAVCFLDTVIFISLLSFFLSLLANTARTLMYVGGVHSIIHMIEKYNDNTDVLQYGCTALGTFASHGEKIKVQFIC